MAGGYSRYPTSGAGGGNVTGPVSSVDGQVAVFSGTSGQTLAAATGTGIAHLASGVLSASLMVNADVSASAAIDFSKLAALTSGNILVGNVSNVATSVAVTGDVTISNAGVTAIGALKVTNAMLAGSIAYSKLVLTGAVLNADLAGSIAYSKLSLTGAILNADLAGSIAASKLVGSDIATVGTVTTGTWSATAIAATKGGTGLTAYTLGDTIYSSATNTLSALAGNTTSTKKFKTQTGTGTVSAAPAWSTIVASDLPLPTASTMGGVFSKAVVSNNFLTGISSVDGSVTAAQPAFTNISGSVAASQMPALTGDVTTSAGAVATSLVATSNATLASLDKSTGVAVHGTNTNDSAAAGYVGQYIESLVTSATAMSASSTWQDATSIALTAGDWDVTLAIDLISNSAAGISLVTYGIGTGTGTSVAGLTAGVNQFAFTFPTALTSGAEWCATVPSYRVSITGSPTYYAKLYVTYPSTAATFRCRFSARRIR